MHQMHYCALSQRNRSWMRRTQVRGRALTWNIAPMLRQHDARARYKLIDGGGRREGGGQALQRVVGCGTSCPAGCCTHVNKRSYPKDVTSDKLTTGTRTPTVGPRGPPRGTLGELNSKKLKKFRFHLPRRTDDTTLPQFSNLKRDTKPFQF
jgi:hypothetical protein